MENTSAISVLIVTDQIQANNNNVKSFAKLLSLSDFDVSFDSQLPLTNGINDFDLYFVDCLEVTKAGKLPTDLIQIASETSIVMFNCLPDSFCEKVALMGGVRGVFYTEDRADIVVKGLDMIKQGERWFRRSIMNSALSDLLKNSDSNQNSIVSGDSEESSLTKREKTIVGMISSGAQNKEIAEQLHISPNTVKTHLYSIFRKTSSRNRVELLAWSRQFDLSY